MNIKLEIVVNATVFVELRFDTFNAVEHDLIE